MTNIDYGKELQNAYDEGYAKAKSEIKSIWHTTDEVPQVPESDKSIYPHVPCIVDFGLRTGGYGIRSYNPTEHCWDDEDEDDFSDNFTDAVRWAYLSDIVEL